MAYFDLLIDFHRIKARYQALLAFILILSVVSVMTNGYFSFEEYFELNFVS
jgi:hypothetical protein